MVDLKEQFTQKWGWRLYLLTNKVIPNLFSVIYPTKKVTFNMVLLTYNDKPDKLKHLLISYSGINAFSSFN